jgi:RimJ/RimL family protein N-acetyltransferase
MVLTHNWLKSYMASFQAWMLPALDLSAAAASGPDRARESVRSVAVPMVALGLENRPDILRHLLSLDENDRYLRFGYMANDEQITRYVDGLNFERDGVYGIFDRGLKLVAVAHLAFAQGADHGSCAEFGVSVSREARGRGYGGGLFERAAQHARNQGVSMLFIHALTENTPMLRIARSAGASVERDGSETEAYLKLPPPNLDSQLAEMVENRMAEMDYNLKVQAKHFWDTLASLQQVRSAVTLPAQPAP